MRGPIALLVSDLAVLSSLQFALSIEGFALTGAGDDLASAALVVDQGYRGDGLAALASLRAKGCTAPAILLATNPSMPLRTRAACAGAALIEKPLLGDELSSAITRALQPRKAA